MTENSQQVLVIVAIWLLMTAVLTTAIVHDALP